MVLHRHPQLTVSPGTNRQVGSLVAASPAPFKPAPQTLSTAASLAACIVIGPIPVVHRTGERLNIS